MMRVLQFFHVLGCIAAFVAASLAPSRAAAGSPPTFVLAVGKPVTIEEADRVLRARQPAVPKPTALLTAPTALPVAAAGCATGPSPAVEITTLAAALKCDPDLIFEYVYNNIEYEPLFGSNKGPLATLLDQRGSDIDQAQLFVALLAAAGVSSSQMSFIYGNIRVTGAIGPGWLGVKNDGIAIGNLLSNGGIPVTIPELNSDGTLNYIDVAHVWVQLNLNGTNYVFDPSFKQHSVSAGLGNLVSVLGYTQSQFLADAGGTIDSVSIAGIDRQAARNDLTTYAQNLIAYIKNHNPAWTLQDIVGGKTIQYLTGSPLRQASLPYLSPSQPPGFPQTWPTIPNGYRTCFTISMPGVTPQPCSQASSQSILLYSDQTYGHRITVFSTGSSCAPPSGSCTPTLLIDGAPPPNGQNTGTTVSFGSQWAVAIDITHPYAGSTNCAGANQCDSLTITAGGSYLIAAGWGQVGRGMIEKHRRLLAQALAAGDAANSEAVLGESLAVISYSWLAERAAVQRLTDALGGVTTQYHHGVGITAQAAIQGQSGAQGPYVDLPLNFVTLVPQVNYTGSGLPPAFVGALYTEEGVGSSLESAVLEQTQALVAGMQAASTVRLVDMNLATGAKTYFADGTTTAGVQAYFSSIRPNLAGYLTSDLSFIDNSISTDGTSTGNPTGKQALLPAVGNIRVGLWTGAGYTVSYQQNQEISILQKISGGLSGGFSGSDIPPATVGTSTQNQTQPPSASPAIPAGVMANPPAATDATVAEPVDAITGAYIYQHVDLTTGGGSFPYALTFGRTYTSSANGTDLGLGNGWADTYSIAATRISDPYAAMGGSAPIGAPAAIAASTDMGENSAISAAAAIAAIYVSQDLLSGNSPKNAQYMTLAWLVDRWLTDQLTNNAVLVSWPGSSEEFTVLPHDDGASSVTYNPPLGSAVVLTGSAPDQYGNFTTFTYRNKDQSQITFTPVNAAATGQIASWSLPYGMSVNFAYNYSYDGTTYLTGISNTLGRSLALAYSGPLHPHLSSVTDDTGRSVTYGYDGNNNLVSVADPLGFRTTFAYDGAASHLTQVFYPSQPANAFVTNAYDGLGRVSQQANAEGSTSNFYIAGSRTEVIDPAGDRHVTYQTPGGRVIKDAGVLSSSFGDVFNDTTQQNGTVDVANSTYDGLDRLILATAPEGGTVGYAYSPDLENNIVAVTRTPKPGSSLSPLTTTYTYDPTYNKPTSTTDPLGLVTQMSYDPATGNLLSIVADAGSSSHFNATQRFTYSGQGQILTATSPLGTVTQYTYDGSGNRTSITRDAGSGHLNQLTRMSYSALGDVTAVTDPNGDVTTSTFDADRRLAAVTLPGTPAAPGGVVTAFSYDPDGRPLQTRQSAGGAVLRTTSATYTLTGKIATATDADGSVTRYTYDPVDRLSSIADPMGRVTRYAYDAMSRRTAVSNAAIQPAPLLQQGYTPDGLLGSLTDANGHATAFAYDGLDRLSTTTYPDGSTEVLGYDADGNVLTRQTRKGDSISFAYDTLNRRCTKTYAAAAVSCGGTSGNYLASYSYDLAGHLIASGDNAASITAVAASASYAETMSYDALNDLTNASWSPAPAQTLPTAAAVTFNYQYDATNRRIRETATDKSWWNYPTTAGSTSYTANALNQYTAVGSAAPTYDADGDLAGDGTYSYCYDAERRVTAILSAGTCASPTTVVASYAYDAQGRRKSKTVGSTTTIYVTDADNREVLDYAGSSGAVGAWYAYAAGANAVLNRMNVAGSSRQMLIPDIQGSIVGSLEASTGALTGTGYQPFGANPSLSGGSFQYTAARFDPESGFYYMRTRMYRTDWGRFTQPDLIGYAGGANLYAYVGNDPLNATDPLGLWQITVSGGYGLFGSLTFGYNSGQFNLGAAVGAGVGLSAAYNPSDTGLQAPGYSTSIQGQGEVGLLPGLGAGVSASAQTSVPNGRISNQGTANAQAYVNFPAYSAGVQANVSPNGQVTTSAVAQPGIGGNVSLTFGVTYAGSPAVGAQPNQGAAQTSSVGAGK